MVPSALAERAAVAPEPAGSPFPTRRRAWLGALARADHLIPATGCATLLLSCVLISMGKPMWADEVFSYTHVTLASPIAMLRAIIDATDITPPLYHLISWIWVRVVGDSELALRLFTSLAMSGALVVHYRTLRRGWGATPALLAAPAVMLGSGLVLYQNAEARFYGMFALLAALAIELAARAAEVQRPSRRHLALTTLAHGALVMTHVFGVVYGGAILGAILLRDRRRRVWRPTLWASIALAWLPLVAWLPALINHADVGRPESWVPVPTPDLLPRLYAFGHQEWYLLVSVLLLLVGWDAAARAHGADLRSRATLRRVCVRAAVTVIALLGARMVWFAAEWWGSATWSGAHLLTGAIGYAAGPEYRPILTALLFGGALMVLRSSPAAADRAGDQPATAARGAVTAQRRARSLDPIGRWVTSGPGTRRGRRREQLVFVAGVFLIVPLPVYAFSQVGPSIFVARYMLPTLFAWSIVGAVLLAGVGRGRVPASAAWMRTMTRVGILLLAGWLVLEPLRFADHYGVHSPPILDIAGVNVDGIPIATDDLFLFLPAQRQGAPVAGRPWLLLDSAIVFASPRLRGATTSFKLMQAWRRHELAPRIVDARAFLCTTTRFLFIEDSRPRSRVLERRIVPDSTWSVRLIQERAEFLLHEVERRRSVPPAACATTDAD